MSKTLNFHDLSLPTSLVLTRRDLKSLPRLKEALIDDYLGLTDEELEDVLLNYLSDTYGFCLNSFSYKVEEDLTKGGRVERLFFDDIDWDVDD